MIRRSGLVLEFKDLASGLIHERVGMKRCELRSHWCQLAIHINAAELLCSRFPYLQPKASNSNKCLGLAYKVGSYVEGCSVHLYMCGSE